VVAALARTSFANAAQYRADFLFDGVTGLLRVAGVLVPVALVFGQREEVLGWTAPELTLVTGLFFFVQALLTGVVEPNLGEVVEAVRSGSFDFLLLKPVDPQLLASVRRIAPARIWDLLAATGLVGWSLSRLPPPAPLDVLAAAVTLLSGLSALYGVWLLAICASFWFVRVDNLRYLLWAVSDAGRWPLSVFGPAVRTALVLVVPIGVATTFPALALRGEWTAPLVAGAVGVGAAFALGSRWVWTRALASYTSASS
jgi:ABC-2 type transport system permease protein